jgi:PAS domain S-box-containing protein
MNDMKVTQDGIAISNQLITEFNVLERLYKSGPVRKKVKIKGRDSRIMSVQVDIKPLGSPSSDFWIASLIQTHEYQTADGNIEMQAKAFELIVENCDYIVTRHGKDFRYLYASPSIQEALGIPAHQFIGKTYYELGMPEHVCKYWDEQLASIFVAQRPVSLEFVMPEHNAVVQSKLIPEFDEQGEMVSVLILNREISKKKKTEEDLERVASHLRLATEAANIGTWLYDVTSQKVEWSSLHKKMWGYEQKPGEMLYQDWYACIHPDDRLKTTNAFEQYLSIGGRYDVEYRIIRADDNELRWIRSVGQFHNEGAGQKQYVSGISVDVSEQKFIEEKLREGEERFRGTFENAAVGISHVALDGKWLRVNDKLCEIVGYTQDELLQSTFQDITHPDDLQNDLEHLQQLYKGEISNYSIEKRYFHKNAKVVWVNLTVSLVRDHQGDPSYYISVVEDITSRKNAEQALKESNDRYQLINKATQDTIWDWNLLTNELHWNENVYSMFHYDPGTVPSTIDWWDNCIHPEDRDRVLRGIHGVIDSSGDSWSDEYRFLCGDGSYKVVYDRGILLHDKSGKSIRMVGSMQDITDRKKFIATLEEQEQRFRTLVNSISQLAWIATSEGWIYWYNERWYEYTGTTLEEMQGWGWTKVHHPEHVQRVVSFFTNAWSGTEPVEITFPLRAKDGTYRWFLTRAFPVKDNDGKVLQWVGTNTDIHDQKTLAERLETMVAERTKELQRSNDDLQQFAHVVSHDLKEPVRKIRLFSSKLELDLENIRTEKSRAYLQKIQKSTDRVMQMIEGTLSYSTVGAKEFAYERLDLNKVIEQIETDLEVLIQQKNAKLVYQNLASIEGAPVLIYQLFYNLINNSLKFSRQETPCLISISSTVNTDAVEVQVSDNGIGFEPLYAETIFNAYTRLNSKDQFEGTGLGLALCKKIVERHHGTIHAVGKKEEGATFIIRLPNK